MKARICIALIMCVFSAYSQDTISKKLPVFTIGIRSLYAIMPYNYTLSLSTFNLKNNTFFSYNNFHNTVHVKRPGIQFGYNRYFFKKTGTLLGLSYNYVFGEFSFVGERAKYDGYTYFKNLEYLNLNCGFFYRFKFRKFGIIEPSFALTYFLGIKSNDREYFTDLTMPRILLNLDLKYYFKRNKVKQ